MTKETNYGMCINNGKLLSNKKKLLMQDMMIHADLQMLSERSQAKASLYNMDPFLKIRIMETNV